MTLTEPFERVFVARYPTQYELTATFMRLQEFYESPSPAIRRKVLSLEEFMDAYAAHYGNFDYHTAYTGFNVPGITLGKFFNAYVGRLTRHEDRLFRMLTRWVPHFWGDAHPYYLVGIFRDEEMDHELAHAFYGLHARYRQRMDSAVRSRRDIRRIRAGLRSQGYNAGQYLDEAQAYLATSPSSELRERWGFEPKSCGRIRTTFREWKDKLAHDA